MPIALKLSLTTIAVVTAIKRKLMRDEVLTIKAAAIRIGKSEKTIYNWINAGHLHPLRQYVLLSELVVVERAMSEKRGRPRKNDTPS
jgi:IS30 family transposase